MLFLTLLLQNSVKFVKNLYQEKDYRIFKGFSCIFIDPSEGYDGQAADELDQRMITYFHETNSEENSWMFYIGNQFRDIDGNLIDIDEDSGIDYLRNTEAAKRRSAIIL